MEKPNNMKTEIEKIKFAISETLKLIGQPNVINYAEQTKKQAIIDLLYPKQPEGYQGLNKWYLISTDALIRATSEMGDRVCGYGVSYINEWRTEKNGFSCNKSQIVRELTDPEIIEAIKKGLEQKGIVKGVSVKDLKDNLVTFISNSDRFIFDEESNTLHFNSVKVFDNGTFAEVVKETELQEYKKTHQLVNPLKDSSDKELLRECCNLLQFLAITHGRTTHIVDLKNKLNKHLNHVD